MADPTGFMKHHREQPSRRPVPLRLQDWREVYEEFDGAALKRQATRCMDCGIPFCHNGCPLGNLIPEWNDLARREDWEEAIERLHATNNFPEFTGRLCPAPCETACVLGINNDPVSIKQIEVEIVDRAWREGWVRPQRPLTRTGKKVAVVGSGPAGLAAAQQLTRAGHAVTVFERDDRIGGLLRYGIPEFKMEKRVLDRRLRQMRSEGTKFVVRCNVGVDVTTDSLLSDYDAVVLAGGATIPRDLPTEGRDLEGIMPAMDYLVPANRVQLGDYREPPVSAQGRHVVIIGGGDTGADCLGTAHRQGAASVTQLEIMPQPPQVRAEETPWPTWPLMYRTSSAHEEGGERVFSVNTSRFLGGGGPDGKHVRAVEIHDVRQVTGAGGRTSFEKVPGTERELRADLVFLAMGFTGADRRGLVDELGAEVDARGNVVRDGSWMSTVPGVFVAGDMGRGQSLIVWAIAEGRACAASVDAYLGGGASRLPVPVHPTTTAIAAR